MENAIITAYIDIEFRESEEFTFDMIEDDNIYADIVDTFLESERYTGEYIVTPDFVQQILDTKQKLMLDDVTVKKIPVSETHNPFGGITISIGDEINEGA